MCLLQLSPLALTKRISKVKLIISNISAVYFGTGPDYRVLADKSRKVIHTEYKRISNKYPPTKILISKIATILKEAILSDGIRCFGISRLVTGHDENWGFSLYQLNPSGSYFPYKATTISKGSTAAKPFLEKRWNHELELEDTIHIVLLTLKESVEGEFKVTL